MRQQVGGVGVQEGAVSLFQRVGAADPHWFITTLFGFGGVGVVIGSDGDEDQVGERSR